MRTYEEQDRAEMHQLGSFLESIPDKFKMVWERKYSTETTLQGSYNDWRIAEGKLQKLPPKHDLYLKFALVIAVGLGMLCAIVAGGGEWPTAGALGLFLTCQILSIKISNRIGNQRALLAAIMKKSRCNLIDFRIAMRRFIPIVDGHIVDPMHLTDDGIKEQLVIQAKELLEAQDHFVRVRQNLSLGRISVVTAAQTEEDAQAGFDSMIEVVAEFEIFSKGAITEKDIFDKARKRIQKLRPSEWKS